MAPGIKHTLIKEKKYLFLSSFSDSPLICVNVSLVYSFPTVLNDVFALFLFPQDDQQLEAHDNILIVSTGARTEWILDEYLMALCENL